MLYSDQSHWTYYVSIIAVLLCVATVGAAIWNSWKPLPPFVRTVFFLGWSLGPPAWLFLQYYCLFLPYAYGHYMKDGMIDPKFQPAFDYFKYGQQLTGGVWAGLAAFLTASVVAQSLSEKKRTPEVRKAELAQLLAEGILTPEEVKRGSGKIEATKSQQSTADNKSKRRVWMRPFDWLKRGHTEER